MIIVMKKIALFPLIFSGALLVSGCSEEPEPKPVEPVAEEAELTKKQVEPELPTFEAETLPVRSGATTDEIRGLALSDEQRTVVEVLGGVTVPGRRSAVKPLNSAVIRCIEQLSLESRGMPTRFQPRVLEACELELVERLEKGESGVTVEDIIQPDMVEIIREAWEGYEVALQDR